MPKQTSLLPTTEAPSITETMDLPTLLSGDATLLAPLKLAGIHTVEALTALTGAEVRNRKGMGPKRVMAVHDALRAHGLDFAPEATKARKTPKGEFPGMKNLTDRWCAFFERATGQKYMWTSGGQTSDNKAAQAIYTAVGWSADPSPEVEQGVGDMVRRYVKHCLNGFPRRVPTLYDLARNLAQFRQADVLVDATRQPDRVSNARRAEEERIEGMRRLLAGTPTTTEVIDA